MTNIAKCILWGFLIMGYSTAIGQNHFVVYKYSGWDSIAYTIINEKGEEVGPIPKGWVPHMVKQDIGYFEGGIHSLRRKDFRPYEFCMIDTTGEVIDLETPVQFSGRMKEGVLAVKGDGKIGYINNMGKVVIPFKYDQANNFENGLARVMENRKNGLIDKTGKYIIPPEYSEIALVSEGLIYVSKNREEFGFFDNKGTLVIPFLKEYYNPSCHTCGRAFNNGRFRVRHKTESLFGYLNKKGELLIPLQFEMAYDFQNGLALVKKGGLHGFIDTIGHFAIPAIYPAAQPFVGEGAWVLDPDEKLWGLLDRQGKYLVEPRYENYPFRKNTLWMANEAIPSDVPEKTRVEIGKNNNQGGTINTFTFHNQIGEIAFKLRDSYAVYPINDEHLFVKWKRLKISNNYSIINNKGELVWQPAAEDVEIDEVDNTGFFSKEEVVNLNLERRNYYKRDKENLPTFAPEIWAFQNLKTLKLEGHYIVNLPDEIGRLENLESLNLFNCGLESLPKEIFKLKKLKELNLEYNPELKKLPRGFARKMKHLEVLNVKKCGFSPDVVHRLKTKMKDTWLIYR